MRHKAAFGNPVVYIEKFLEKPRHVEFQVLADSHGKGNSSWNKRLFTSKTSSKNYRGGPAPGISEKQMNKIGARCASACEKINYRGAGTFEFLYENNEFYFIEMNTRLQVEHTVTELITDIDLGARTN
jgi:acetyl-CoA carboxylase biotin carboxylase subunit